MDSNMDNALVLVLFFAAIVFFKFTYKKGWLGVAVLGLSAIFYLVKCPSWPLSYLLLVFFLVFFCKKLFFDKRNTTNATVAQRFSNSSDVLEMSGLEYEEYVAARLREKG